MEYYSGIKKKKILPLATVWMELDGIMLSEVSHSELDKYHKISFICGIWETKLMGIGEGKEKQNRLKTGRETNHKRPLSTENKLRVPGGEVGGGWGNWLMDIKEGPCCHEHWVLYATDESLNSTPKLTRHYMLANLTLNKTKKKSCQPKID